MNKKKISVNIHHDNHSNTRLRPFITNAYHDAMRNSNPRPSSRPRNNLRAVTPSEDEAQCAGAEGQESEDRRTRWHCFGKSQSLNNLLDKSKQIPELMVMVEIEDRV